MIHEINLKTKNHDQMIDITDHVQKILIQENVKEGIVVVFSSHTTAGITINENADPDVQRDFLRRLEELYPWNTPNNRHVEENSAAHLKASTVGASQTVIINHGKLQLGRWQVFTFGNLMGQGYELVM